MLRAYKGHSYLKRLYTFAYEEMSPLDVLDSSVMFRIICQIACSGIIDAQRSSPLGLTAQLTQNPRK